MPLLKYFGFVGSALLLLLLALNWLLPEVKTESVNADAEKPVIRISSIEKLPEKVDIDTNLSTIAPSLAMIAIDPPVLQSPFVFVQMTPGSLPSFSAATTVVTTAEAAVTPRVTKQSGRGAAKPHSNASTDRAAPAPSHCTIVAAASWRANTSCVNPGSIRRWSRAGEKPSAITSSS
jgi:hypothetical protein